MGYVENNLSPGENIVYKAEITWFVFLKTVLFLSIGYFIYSIPTTITYYIGIILMIMGAINFIKRLIIKIGSLYIVTNKRVILKTGLLNRNALELVLAKCEGIGIEQSLLGRILNYGTIIVTTGGATNRYGFVKNPIKFRKAINDQIQ